MVRTPDQSARATDRPTLDTLGGLCRKDFSQPLNMPKYMSTRNYIESKPEFHHRPPLHVNLILKLGTEYAKDGRRFAQATVFISGNTVLV
jgi:hypothetical protein